MSSVRDLGRVIPLMKGEYAAASSYELNDIVNYQGSCYWHIGSTTTTGVSPTDSSVWTVLAAGGGSTENCVMKTGNQHMAGKLTIDNSLQLGNTELTEEALQELLEGDENESSVDLTEIETAIANISNETWTFTLSDNTTVTKIMKVGTAV